MADEKKICANRDCPRYDPRAREAPYYPAGAYCSLRCKHSDPEPANPYAGY